MMLPSFMLSPPRIRIAKWLLILALIYFLWKKISALFKGVPSPTAVVDKVVSAVADKKTQKEEKKAKTGLDAYLEKTPYTQAEFSEMASDIAINLGLHKSLSWLERNTSLENEGRVLEILKPLTKYAIQFVAKYYRDEHTTKRDLRFDLKRYLSSAEYDKIKDKLTL